MEDIIKHISELFVYGYTGSIILLSYFILNRIIINPKSRTVAITTVVVGIILGVIWYYWVEDTPIDKLIVSFTFANSLYSLVIKQILSYFKTSYKNNKGLI